MIVGFGPADQLEKLVPGRVIRPAAGPALIAISVIHFATTAMFYGAAETRSP